jgi:membrane protease YdiL (CAAX protease family)
MTCGGLAAFCLMPQGGIAPNRMIGPWINNESQRLVVALGPKRQEGPRLDMSMFVVGLAIILLLVCFSVVLPVSGRTSDRVAITIAYGGLAILFFFLQREYRPRADQLGLRLTTLTRLRVLLWATGGIAFTAVELGLMYGFARFVLSTLPQHHVWTIGLQPLDRLVRRPFDLLIPIVAGPVLEELLFRGYLYLVFRQNWGPRRAALVSSALFSIVHLPTAPLVAISFFASLIYVYLNNKARSLAPSVAAHASYNAVLWLLKSNLT